MRFEKESFGATLRAGRERRKVPLSRIVQQTKTRPEIWNALEENDFSKWPTRIYARSLIRQYAEHVGLDPEELVNEFCRLFPHGDRRGDTLLREQAGLIGHALDWREELPPSEPQERRSDGSAQVAVKPQALRLRASWLVAAALDVSIVVAIGGTVTVAFGIDPWRSLATCALAYHAIAVAKTGRTGGVALGEWLVRRALVPARLQDC